jgi:anti-sigma regulatory factor (Ser/Thr protein kinase)
MHFTCYALASGRHVLVHIVSLLDGFVCVAGFSAILIPAIGMNGLYYANILNGVVIILVFFVYACIRNRNIPRDMFDLMAVPHDFGVEPDQRMDITVRTIDEVVTISEKVQTFCLERGIDNRRSYLAGLALEELAGNIIKHGFGADSRDHTIDVRVVHKGDDVILRLRDDCIPFDPVTMRNMAERDDAGKNIGLRMIFGILKDIEYQNLLGLNVLTMKI